MSLPLPEEERGDWPIWIGSAMLAISAHAAGFAFAAVQVPEPDPEAPPTEIVVEVIELAGVEPSPDTLLAEPPDVPKVPILAQPVAPAEAAPLATPTTETAQTAEAEPAPTATAPTADTASAVPETVETAGTPETVAAEVAAAPESAPKVNAPTVAAPESVAAVPPPKVETATRVAEPEPETAEPAVETARVAALPAAEPAATPQVTAPASIPSIAPLEQVARPAPDPIALPGPAAPAQVATAPLVTERVRPGAEVSSDLGTGEPLRPATATVEAPRLRAGQAVGTRDDAAPVPVAPPAARVATVVPSPQVTAPETPPEVELEAAPVVVEPEPSETEPEVAPRLAAVDEALTAVAPTPDEEPEPDPEPAVETLSPKPIIPEGMVAERLAPRTSAAEPVTALPSVSGSTAPAPESDDTEASSAAPAPEGEITQDDRNTYQAILEYMRGYEGGSCFAALPALGEETAALTLDAFGETSKRLDGFQDGLEEKAGIVPGTFLKPVSPAQCATLGFIKTLPSYPAFGLYFELEQREMQSGDTLRGRVFNTQGRNLHLLLIDDEGTVQALDSFVQFTRTETNETAASFAIPMTFQGGPIVTQQLLLALATPGRIRTVRDMNGTEASVFFLALKAELEAKGISPDLSMVAFSVK